MDKSDNGFDGGGIIIDADTFYIGMKPYWLFNIIKETKMSKFKVGDTVRLKNNSPETEGQFTHGKEYTVVGFTEYGVRLAEDDSGDANGWVKEYFELASKRSPVRTVTRTEILPGVYGIVRVSHLDGVTSLSLNPFDKAEELREAAHTLNQIAEALDDA